MQAKFLFLGAVGLCFIAGGQVFASALMINDSYVNVTDSIIVAQSFEEQREQSRREFEERSEQNRREFERQKEQNRRNFEAKIKKCKNNSTRE